MSRRRCVVVAVTSLLVATGCGDSTAERKPRSAYPGSPEPAVSPPPAAKPAGRVVRLGAEAEGMVADGPTGLVAVGLRNPGRLALVDARSGRVVKRVPLAGPPRHLQLQRPGGPVLVPSEETAELLAVSLPLGRVSATRVGRQPHDATARGDRIFVGNERADTMSVIDGARVTRTVPVPYGPGGLAISGDKVAVVGVIERMIELFDARTSRSLARIGAGVGPTHLVADRRGRLYVADTEGDAIIVYHVRPRFEQAHRITVRGKPYGLASDLQRDRLWITSTARNELIGFDLASFDNPRPPLVYPTVRQPNTVAVDPRNGRVFVAGRAGELQIIDPPGTVPPRPLSPGGYD